jgi:hypothetical protein
LACTKPGVAFGLSVMLDSIILLNIYDNKKSEIGIWFLDLISDCASATCVLIEGMYSTSFSVYSFVRQPTENVPFLWGT